MSAGAECEPGVQHQLDAVGVVLLPGGHHRQPPADLQRVVIFAPAVLPVLLLDAGGLHRVGDTGGVHPGVDGGQRLGRLGPRLEVDVDDDHVPGLFQQLGLDQVHMGDLRHLLLDVAVIFNINTALGDHGRGGLGLLGVLLGHRQADVGPFHSVCLLYK